LRVGNYKIKNRVVVRFMRRSSGASYQKLEITQATSGDFSKAFCVGASYEEDPSRKAAKAQSSARCLAVFFAPLRLCVRNFSHKCVG
jgi:hypothetical protein